MLRTRMTTLPFLFLALSPFVIFDRDYTLLYVIPFRTFWWYLEEMQNRTRRHITYKSDNSSFLSFWFISFCYAPNFKEVRGAYCFWVVCPSVRPSVCLSRFLMHSITLEPWMLLFWNFLYGFLMKKIVDTYFFFLTGLCTFSELWPFEKIWMQSCQQNISKTIAARAMKLHE